MAWVVFGLAGILVQLRFTGQEKKKVKPGGDVLASLHAARLELQRLAAKVQSKK